MRPRPRARYDPNRSALPTEHRETSHLIGWGRKRSRRWVALVLPGLLLRALIPLGFMPMFGPGLSVQLMLCEGYAPVPSPAAEMPMDMPMDMPMGATGHHSPTHQDHAACPFGASPVFASLPVFSVELPTISPAAKQPLQSAQLAHLQITPRAQSPRGPPLEV